MKDTVALRYTLTRDIHIPNKHIYILLHVVIAFILQSLATFPDPLISVQHKNLACSCSWILEASMKIFQYAEWELVQTCQQNVALCDLTHYEHNACFFFLCTGAHGHFMNHRRRKNKEEKMLGESALEVRSFKKGFEEHCDILTCIWQDQVWLQFIAALSSALGKTEPTTSRWRGAKEEHIKAVTLLTLSQLFSAPSLFEFPALPDLIN